MRSNFLFGDPEVMRAVKSNDSVAALATLAGVDGARRVLKRAVPATTAAAYFLLFCAAFFVAYLYAMSFHHKSASPFWAPDAILLSALLFAPRRRWWLFLLAPLPIRLLVAVPDNTTLWFLLSVYLNDSMKALVSAAILKRLSGGTPRLASMQELIQFLAVAVIGTPMLSASFGALTRLALNNNFWDAWTRWFLGDALANLIITPMIIYWSAGSLRAMWSASRERRVEGALLLAALGVVGFKALSGDGGSSQSPVLIYFPFPLLLYAAVRFGPAGVSSALCMVAAFATWNAEHGRGPFSTETPGGDILSLQLFLCVTSIPLLCVAVLLRERQRVAASLREATAQLARTESFSLVMVTRIGLDGRWLKVPPTLCNLLGYSEEELLAGYVKDVTRPDDFEAEWRQCVRLISGEIKSFALEKRFVHKNGDPVWTYLNCSIVTDEDGRPLHFLNYIKDITERHLAEETIRKLNFELELRVTQRTAALNTKSRELETFAYSVAHDLKAPLRGIEGYSRLLLEDYAEKIDEDGREFLKAIRASSEQMNQLIEDLLAYSRVERRELNPSRLELAPLVESLVAQKKHEAGRDIEFVLSLKCGTVRADPDALTQALRNYLDNAVKFTSGAATPRIEVGAQDNERGCRLWVRDNGIGFDMKYHNEIFEIFRRLHHNEDYVGTGVGLAIVRKAMERIGGTAWAESEPGKGATFYLELLKQSDGEQSWPTP
jgi:PAS domain S-box-containing protein